MLSNDSVPQLLCRHWKFGFYAIHRYIVAYKDFLGINNESLEVSKQEDKERGTRRFPFVVPNVAKAGGFQSQGVKGEAVVAYRESLTTQDLKFSGFPEGLTTW